MKKDEKQRKERHYNGWGECCPSRQKQRAVVLQGGHPRADRVLRTESAFQVKL
jgi:hypothetical protein